MGEESAKESNNSKLTHVRHLIDFLLLLWAAASPSPLFLNKRSLLFIIITSGRSRISEAGT